MVFELFKVVASFIHLPFYPSPPASANGSTLQNAMRATMELHGDALHYPPIRAQVALGNEDLTVKVRLRPPGTVSLSLPLRLCAFCSVIPSSPSPYVLSRWATVAVASRCVRSTGCSPTPTLRRRGPAWTAPAPPHWSVPSLCFHSRRFYKWKCVYKTGLLNRDTLLTFNKLSIILSYALCYQCIFFGKIWKELFAPKCLKFHPFILFISFFLSKKDRKKLFLLPTFSNPFNCSRVLHLIGGF